MQAFHDDRSVLLPPSLSLYVSLLPSPSWALTRTAALHVSLPLSRYPTWTF